MAKHIFNSEIDWAGGRNAVGHLQTGVLKEKISVPSLMEGPGEGTNPDEMLLGAASTCYTITLAAMLERNEIGLINLKVDSTGVVDVTNGVFTYEKIIHHVFLKLTSEADETKARKLAERAETSCMISRAIRGNVQLETVITFES
ncbi:OsmC family protein [Lactococcus allomyrinae]|uniref:OsmC family peroxiredoxin n=1 Tax=Lactococcus allomyrinae TaxID=2419773 RepID=A0A387BHQ4_9LACT|nr:OsmC family protein [Lactococcus allomyrinae]AYG01794.1 OsmC family peroxiredoxin [Lactococcus allomyrinae]